MNDKTKKQKRIVGPAETAVGVVVLLVLVLVAAVIYLEQYHYDPSLFELDSDLLKQPAAKTHPTVEILQKIAEELPLKYSPIASFDSENVYEKINGRDQMFLSLGFVRLDVLPCELAGQGTFEIFIYDMAEPENAFGIFAAMRSDDPAWQRPNIIGTVAQNGVFFFKGRYYVCLIGSDTTAPLIEMIKAAAVQLAETLEGYSVIPAVAQKFPKENLLPDSIGYTAVENRSEFAAPAARLVYLSRPYGCRKDPSGQETGGVPFR